MVSKYLSLLALGCRMVLIVSTPVMADVHLPAMYSDHMVLQRGVPVHLHGTATPEQTVTVSLESASWQDSFARGHASECGRILGGVAP